MKALFFLAVCIFSALQVGAQQGIIEAPLNPDYLEYLEKKKKGLMPKKSPRGYYYGHIPPPVQPVLRPAPGVKSMSFPTSYDLREYDLVTSVKNQGQCGSCWAFAANGAIESNWLRQGYGYYDLSEDHLNNCHLFSYAPCGGGNWYMVTSMYTRGYGPMNEADDPYSGPDDNTCPVGLTPVAYVTDMWYCDTRIESIKDALLEYGGMYVTLSMDEAFYDTLTHSYYSRSAEGIRDHAVVLVGWDDEMETPADQPGAWILKNSWGEEWGDDGYFYISYYDSTGLGLLSFAPDRLSYDPGITISGHDKVGWTTTLGYDDGKDDALVKFVPFASKQIRSIGTYAVASGTEIDIWIYDEFDGSNLGGLLGSLSGRYCEHAGYHTFDLPEPVYVSSGNDYFVKATYNTGTKYPIPCERNTSNTEIADSGWCWVSSDGSSWFPLGNGLYERDVCIKTYGKIGDSYLKAHFYAEPTSGIVPLTVEFTDSSVGDVSSWQWDFNGDGAVDATHADPVYQYTDAGLHDVSLTVSDGIVSDTATRYNYIRVWKKPLADFTGEPTSGFAPLEVRFTDQSTGDVNNWSWDFDQDGTEDANTQNPVHEYTEPGIYTVSLVAGKNSNYDTIVKAHYIEVKADGRLGFAWDDHTEVPSHKGPVVVNRSSKITNLATNSNDHIVTGDWAHGKWYGCEDSLFVTIDTLSGEITVVDTMSLKHVYGLAYDATTNQMYVAGTNSDRGTNLYELDYRTGRLTYVGMIWTGTRLVGMTCDRDGQLYCLNTPEDALDLLDKHTGNTTTIGPLGIDVYGFSQDIAFDRKADKLYGTLYVDYPVDKDIGENNIATYNYGGLWEINKHTGDASFIGHFDDGLVAFAIPHEYGLTEELEAGFTASPTSGYAPLSVQFTDLSEGDITSWSWDFDGDGTFDAFKQNPGYVYTDTGTFTVSLTVSDAFSSETRTLLDYITVHEPLEADFTASPSRGYPPLTVQFTDQSAGEVISWSWDLDGDGQEDASVPNPVFEYNDTGTYRVSLTVSDGFSTDDRSVDDCIKVQEPLTANFTADPTVGYVPLSVQFTDQSTGEIATWSWDFDGDGREDSNLQHASHQYSDTGSYTVSLTVHDGFSSYTRTLNDYITVREPLSAGFTGEPTSGYAPLTVHFTDLSEGTATSWSWDFDGDGMEDAGTQNPDYEYALPGVYTVGLTVDDGISTDSVVIENYITAVEPPAAGFSAEPATGYAPLTVQFSDHSGGAVNSWSWDFDGDGMEEATIQNPTFEYTEPGIYTVILTVGDGTSTDTEKKTDFIDVLIPLVADFTADVTSGMAPLTVNFTDLSEGSVISWEWDFDGDGSIDASEQHPSYVYNQAGSHSVVLTVSDGFQSIDHTREDYIVVEAQTGVHDVLVEGKAGVYPNPARDVATIVSGSAWHVTGVELMDLEGRVVYQWVANNGVPGDITLDLGSYPAGMYVLKLHSREEVVIVKLVISR